ncbi:MAG: hypothetical protein WAQ98_04025 [Blastocatellia bacterium]
MNPGLIGGIIGGVLGIAGGIIGTYFSIKNTQSKKEKDYMIKASIGCWIGIFSFLALLFFLPKPYNWLAWIPYSLLLPVFITKINTRIAKIRKEENNIL